MPETALERSPATQRNKHRDPDLSTSRIDVGKALKLRLQGNTFEEIASIFGVTRSAVHQAISKFETFMQGMGPGSLTAYAEERGSILNAIEAQAAIALSASLLDGRADKSSPRDLAVTLGVITDKRRLESGQSTSNHAILGKFILGAEAQLGTPQPVDITAKAEKAVSQVIDVQASD